MLPPVMVVRSGLWCNQVAKLIFEHVQQRDHYTGNWGAGGPHDPRRTFTKLGHKGRAALDQIQLSLGPVTTFTSHP